MDQTALLFSAPSDAACGRFQVGGDALIQLLGEVQRNAETAVTLCDLLLACSLSEANAARVQQVRARSARDAEAAQRRSAMLLQLLPVGERQ